MAGWHLWAMIPSMLFLTGFFLVLGQNGYWNYSQQDFLYGNGIIIFGIGFVYLGENIFKRFKKWA